jgi:hypothetical protein
MPPCFPLYALLCYIIPAETVKSNIIGDGREIYAEAVFTVSVFYFKYDILTQEICARRLYRTAGLTFFYGDYDGFPVW